MKDCTGNELEGANYTAQAHLARTKWSMAARSEKRTKVTGKEPENATSEARNEVGSPPTLCQAQCAGRAAEPSGYGLQHDLPSKGPGQAWCSRLPLDTRARGGLKKVIEM